MSVKWVGVLPFAFQPYLDECVATMDPEFKEGVLFIDNTVNNIGIMKAHNLGVEKMYEDGSDWLVIISAAVRFGPKGGLDFIEQIGKHQDHHVIHAATENVVGGLQHKPEGADQKNGVFGWHLTAFHRSVFDTIGVWDTNFSNYSLDDIDLSLRIRKGIKNVKWDTYPSDVTDTSMSHSINLGHIKACAYPPRESYFRRKWGRGGGDWQNDGYEHPFNDPTKPLNYFPDDNDPLSIHQVEFRSGQWSFDD